MPTQDTGVIVVGIDGSENSRRALEWAMDAARRRGARIRAVLVWDDPWSVVGRPSPVSAAGPDLPRLRQVVAATIRDATAESPGEPVQVEAEVKSGRAPEVLASLAADADLLVVGSRGRSGLSGALLGSVSGRCAQLSQVPVVVVPPGYR